MNSLASQFGIWTWGHVIYDYKGFFDNMKKLGMNSIVIWNDIAPINAVEVLEYAHSLGIKVVWGFAWGWVDGCGDNIKCIDRETTDKISDGVIETFKNEYADISPDGIYFQSFTELGDDKVNGICVAEAVTDLVNKTAERIFEINPDIEILFGLHATAVKNNLAQIKKTDKRLRIIWEDCGAFPFAYDPSDVDNFEITKEFVREVLLLRGEKEKCGFIIKGMTTLDWSKFEYHSEPYFIGEKSEDFIVNRLNELKPKWDKIADSWEKNYSYYNEIIKMIKSLKSDAYIYGLIEDGMFEAEIPKAAQMLSAGVLNES